MVKTRQRITGTPVRAHRSRQRKRRIMEAHRKQQRQRRLLEVGRDGAAGSGPDLGETLEQAA